MTAGTLAAVTVTASPASAVANPAPRAGERRNATRLNFGISGTANLSVDVGSGNALFTDRLITLPGVTADVPINLYYNSSVNGSSIPSAVTGSLGSGWSITGFDQRLVANSDGTITYYGPGGLTGVFTPNGTGGFAAPVQFRADLVTVTGGGWKMTAHGTGEVLNFTAAGRLSTDKDRNGNTTTFNYSSGVPVSVVTSRGPNPARTLSITTNGGRITALTQTDGSASRTITFTHDISAGQFLSVTDLDAGVTGFTDPVTGSANPLTRITNPDGASTTLSFSSGKVSRVDQTNAAGAGTSTTRLSYPSTTQTLVADPTTDQSLSVASVPHTTYNLTTSGSQLVSSTTDPNGHTRSKSYTTLQDIASATPAAGGGTTFSYGANSGESLTSVASPAGATGSAAYANTGAAKYLPSSTTDDSGNSLTYTYDGQGNQQTSAQGPSGPPAKVTYNTDGTPATSQSPGAATGVQTSYGYDSLHDLSTITAPTGTSLGQRTYAWDGYGRLRTATDGRGNLSTYTYDDADLITRIHSSNANTADVTYGYDSENRLIERIDGNGTTTYSYDDLGKLLSTSNTAGGGTISYTYDLAGALATETDAHGTTSYGYDAAHLLTSMTYPKGTGTAVTRFANDANGRRTDTWLASNTGHTTWAAHTHTDYDSSGRVQTVLGERGPATTPTTVVNQTACYAAGAVAPACNRTSTTADRTKIRWVSDAVSGETATYSYDTAGRLTQAAVTGGSNPRTYSYAYNAAGNRTSSSVTGTSPTSQSLTFNAGNQISSTGYAYDGSGNQTTQPGHTAAFNANSQQTSTVTGGITTTYSYAGTNQNELLSQATVTSGGATYKYAYGRTDRNGLPVIETVTRTSGTSVANAYLAHDPTGLPVMIQTSTGTVALYVYDGRNNPVALLTDFSSTAYVYSFDPYGTATLTTNSGGTGVSENPYLYGGGLQDRATGHLKYGARWYDPVTGTWTQQDTRNTPLDPSNANRYQYAAGDPINNADPTGTFSWDDFTSTVSSFAGTFAVAGAIIGGTLGLLGGPFAPITVPGGAEAGGLIGGTVGGVIGAIYYFANS
ncbi:RHS repeat domain-containing protein [Jatrophihabitans sp.]|uniref:RHS repeat domain-containing protein n=1 Tax=Jatrophihabitans sp. TaxID=1932789 RepID=UPI002EF6C35C